MTSVCVVCIRNSPSNNNWTFNFSSSFPSRCNCTCDSIENFEFVYRSFVFFQKMSLPFKTREFFFFFFIFSNVQLCQSYHSLEFLGMTITFHSHSNLFKILHENFRSYRPIWVCSHFNNSWFYFREISFMFHHPMNHIRLNVPQFSIAIQFTSPISSNNCSHSLEQLNYIQTQKS